MVWIPPIFFLDIFRSKTLSIEHLLSPVETNKKSRQSAGFFIQIQ